MKQKESFRATLKTMLANRSRRLVSMAVLACLVLTLAVLAWAQPLAVKRYLGLKETRLQQTGQVSLTLRSNGFEPMKVSRAGGSFTLSITNRTSSSAVTLHLYRSNGERVRQIGLSGQGSQWSEVLELASGAYTLVDPTNPAWTCSITIE